MNPTLGPDATGVGWVFEYALVDKTGKHDLAGAALAPGLEPPLRARERARRRRGRERRRLREAVPGQRRPEQAARPTASRSTRSSRAVRASNHEVGGRVLEIAGHEHVDPRPRLREDARRHRREPHQGRRDGTPVRVRDVAEVRIGPDIRRGLAELDGEGEASAASSIMRYGENALDVIDAREGAARRDRSTACPTGVEVVTTYDRSRLIEDSIAHAASTRSSRR